MGLKKIKIKGFGEHCPNCMTMMERREHNLEKDNVKNKLSKMSYYFSEWDYCLNCKHVQHYEKFKTYNKTDKGNIVKFYEEQNSFFKNL